MLARARFQLVFDGGVTLDAQITNVPLDEAPYETLFAGAAVKPFTFGDHSAHPI